MARLPGFSTGPATSPKPNPCSSPSVRVALPISKTDFDRLFDLLEAAVWPQEQSASFKESYRTVADSRHSENPLRLHDDGRIDADNRCVKIALDSRNRQATADYAGGVGAQTNRVGGAMTLVVARPSADEPEGDLDFWLSRPVAERIAAVEVLRRRVFGGSDDATGPRLQRVCRVVQRS